ncbi:2OG-Fe(II) oxygenase family protein [Granulosicoccus sp. 3-233]|uniref:2OG-Fe(II) oxygenase family protein n=1 Tax=Granulosicoccus sp. 3-233 TaxID=3417969 RepID=UPI003D353D24
MVELVAVDYAAADAEQQFVQSLRDTGFGVLRNHPIEQSAVQDIYRHWTDFFNSDEPDNFLFDPQKYDGFFPRAMAETAKGHTVRDIKEYFHYYPWGRCPDALKAEIDAYYQSTIEFAAKLLGWIENQTPPEVAAGYREPLSNMINGSEQTLLRILHYPPIEDGVMPGAIRAGAHEDINLITLLPAANEPGLQVKARDGSWLDVPCDFGNLIINIGDMLQEASGGYFPSTTHRVINPDGQDSRRARISLPLFLHPRPDVVLSDRYTAGSYLQERLEELRSSDKK